jgi:Ca2+-transporting ATPase
MPDGATQLVSEQAIRIRSALPGRFRIWVAGLYHNEELKNVLEKGLNGAASKRTVEVNPIAGTLLILTPRDASADALLSEIESLVNEFASSRAITVSELKWRGEARPLLYARSSTVRSRGVTRKPKKKTWSGADVDAAPDSDAPGKKVVNGKASAKSLFDFDFDFGRRKKAERLARAQSGEEQPEHPWHQLAAERVLELISTDARAGLSPEEASARLARYGVNALPKPAPRSGLAMFADQFKELPVILLAGSTVLSMLTGGVADGMVILCVIVVNGVIGYVTESRAERTIQALTRDEDPGVLVVRLGESLTIAMQEIVPGDLLELAPGTLVPADARIIEARDLTVDESALTGESMPVTKTVAAIDDPDLPLADRTNMVYRGTLVTGGSGLAIAVATGRASQVGQLQSMVTEVERPDTPMQKQLKHLGERTVIMAGVVCGGVFVLGLLRGQPLGAMIRVAVSLAVAAVPEGLPTVAITTLALGIKKMKAQHVLVRRLDAIETLGAVQVLCFDKTGTITENKMRVVQGSVAEVSVTVDGGKTRSKERELTTADTPALLRLLEIGALCSDAKLEPNGAEGPKIKGSSTEAALIEYALAVGVDVAALRSSHPTLQVEHRTEDRKWMATTHRISDSRRFVVAVKGSPMEVLERCQSWLKGGRVTPLSADDRRIIRRQNDRMAGEALRVLGMAYQEHDSEPDASEEGLIWVGMMGLADPPRPGLPELFEKFRRAGVRSVMITGDQSATAYAIAKQIGLAVDGELQTLDSIELEKMDPDVLADVAPRIQVFSRVSPRHKLRIVQALQKSGLVVAMTGDGINDCPALKAADIGVAMGGGGGTVAREVADVILERDDLGAMLTAIEHGRVIHADIKKAVRFILATNLSEILLTFASVAAGFGEGMTPVQLLWINLVSDIFPELALAVQPPEHDVLDRPPRDPEAKMFSKEEFRHMAVEGSFLTLGAMAVYTYGVKRYGMSPQARSVSFVALSAAQLLHAFSTRSERNNIFDSVPAPRNPYLPLSVIGGIGLTVLTQLIPGTRSWLGSGRLMPLVDWAVATGGALGPLLANELVKRARFAKDPEQPDSSTHLLPAAKPA